MSLIIAYQNRGRTINIVIQDANGDTITPGAGDQVRIVVGRSYKTPKLTVASDAPTDNGSTLTAGATNVLRLDAADLNFEPGVYTMFVDLYDNSDSGEWKNVDRQVFHLSADYSTS